MAGGGGLMNKIGRNAPSGFLLRGIQSVAGDTVAGFLDPGDIFTGDLRTPEEKQKEKQKEAEKREEAARLQELPRAPEVASSEVASGVNAENATKRRRARSGNRQRGNGLVGSVSGTDSLLG